MLVHWQHGCFGDESWESPPCRLYPRGPADFKSCGCSTPTGFELNRVVAYLTDNIRLLVREFCVRYPPIISQKSFTMTSFIRGRMNLTSARVRLVG